MHPIDDLAPLFAMLAAGYMVAVAIGYLVMTARERQGELRRARHRELHRQIDRDARARSILNQDPRD